MHKPYVIRPFAVGQISGFIIEPSPEYGKVSDLPVKKGILTSKNRSFPTEQQAKRALARFEKQYFAQ